MRSVTKDLIPAFTNLGLHIIIDPGDSGLLRLLPKSVWVEKASLLLLKEQGILETQESLQTWVSKKHATVVFIELEGGEELMVTGDAPPHTTPATSLRSLLPLELQYYADSICYVVPNKGIVLAIKHKWLPADIYFFDVEEGGIS